MYELNCILLHLGILGRSLVVLRPIITVQAHHANSVTVVNHLDQYLHFYFYHHRFPRDVRVPIKSDIHR